MPSGGWNETAGAAWARFYDRVGSSFAVSVAPKIRAWYETTSIGRENRHLLDVCCGTGQLARHFLDHGYTVTGIDLSEEMLRYARANAGEAVAAGRATFLRADAANFRVDGSFGLATSTFDALQLLPSLDALKASFGCTRRAVDDQGFFVFDLMTRRGFVQDYDAMWVSETDEALYVYRSVFDGVDKAMARMSGFVRDENTQWERFREIRHLTFFESQVVLDGLKEAGWRRVWMASDEDLGTLLEDAEGPDRVFFVAGS
jgi:SAM-dependent methyltransferase